MALDDTVELGQQTQTLTFRSGRPRQNHPLPQSSFGEGIEDPARFEDELTQNADYELVGDFAGQPSRHESRRGSYQNQPQS